MKDELRHIADVDLIIERQGTTVTKVIKNGVVLWPQEPHNGPMLTEMQLKQLQVLNKRELDAKELHMKEYARKLQVGANSRQEGGNHYKDSEATGKCPHCQGAIEHWDWAHNLRALEYASTKYLARWRNKGGLESLKKVIHYVQKLIEIHFPDVVVTVQYSNKVGEPGLKGSKETGGRAGVAEGTAAHQAAVDWRPLERGDSY